MYCKLLRVTRVFIHEVTMRAIGATESSGRTYLVQLKASSQRGEKLRDTGQVASACYSKSQMEQHRTMAMHPMFTLGSMLVHENLRTLASIARSVKLLLAFCAVGRSVAVLAIDVPTGHSDDPDARKRTRRGAA